MVESYFALKKPIDSVFVNEAISIFENNFPNAITEYEFLLTPKLNILINENTDPGYIYFSINRHFRLVDASIEMLDDKQAFDKMILEDKTLLIIINDNHIANIEKLKKEFKELSKINFDKSSILSFFDSKGKPVILMYAKEKNDIEELLKKMKTLKYFNKNKIIQIE